LLSVVSCGAVFFSAEFTAARNASAEDGQPPQDGCESEVLRSKAVDRSVKRTRKRLRRKTIMKEKPS